MPSSISITEEKIILGDELQVTALFNRETSRVFFISNEGVSRHPDAENLQACLDGKLAFDKDAFFFRGDRAKYETNRLMKATDMSMKFKTLILAKSKGW